MNMGERVKRRRIELEMTQKELADKAGYCDKSAVCRLETSEEISFKQAKRLADALGVSVEYILGNEPAHSIPNEDHDYIRISELTKALEMYASYKKRPQNVRDAIDVLLNTEGKR